MRVDLVSVHGTAGYALYQNFNIADEDLGFKLTIGGYSGTAGKYMTVQLIAFIFVSILYM